jgi:2-oxoglutarate ferredoxin oxidoreductase subunit alpha
MPTSTAQGDVMQARWGSHGDHEMVALAPSSVLECYTLTIEAFNIAEKLRTPVIMLMDEMIGHLREKVVLPESYTVIDREKPPADKASYKPYGPGQGSLPDVAPLAAFGTGYRFHVTGLTHGEDGFPTNSPAIGEKQISRIANKISSRRDGLSMFEELLVDDAEVFVVAWGGTARSARMAVREARAQGIKAGLIKIMSVWPFPEKAMAKIRQGSPKAVIVPEMNLGQYVWPVRRAVGDACPVYQVNKIAGQLIEPEEILKSIKEAM